MRQRAFLPLVAFGLSASSLIACSFINKFDEVKDAPDSFDSGADGAEGGPVPPPTEAGTGDTGAFDGGLDADAGPSGPTGAIVVGGVAVGDAGKGFVLAVLDPATGAQLSREKMTVASIQYDGVRDLWYIFENLGVDFQTGPTDQVVLHVRELNSKTGVWTERQKLNVPTIATSDSIAVVRNRIAYFAYIPSDGGAFSNVLVLLDTTDPSNVTILGPNTPVDSIPEGVVGTRAVSGTGGSLTLIRKDTTQCGVSGTNDQCTLTLQRVTIAAGAAPQFAAANGYGGVPRVGASASWGSYIGGGPVNVIAYPASNTASAYLETRLPATNALSGNNINVTITGNVLRPMAISECAQQAFLVELNSGELYGIPLSPGTVVDKNLGHPGQRVLFEPYRNSVLAPYRTANAYEITAFELSGTKSAPALTKRTLATWNPPSDLQPNVVNVKSPLTFACP